MAVEPRIIKRYSNRKLYDTQRSRYVTLDQISEMIRAGEEVQIVDNNSKEDLTSITLAQIIFEEEKKQKSFLSLAAMRNIIQSGGEAIQEAGEKVRSVFRRERERAGGVPSEEIPVAQEGSGATQASSAIKEFLETSQKTFDDWQKRLDERIRAVVESISPFASLQKDVSTLMTKLADLEKKLDELDRKEK